MAYFEKWSSQTADGKSATKGYVVVGTTSIDAARRAVPFQKGSRHDLNSRLIAGSPFARRISPDAFEVDVRFEQPSGSGREDPPEDQGITRYRWGIGSSTEAIDRDVNGNAIVNSAHEPPTNPVMRDFSHISLTVERWESGFNIQRAWDYIDTINSDSWMVGGVTFNPGKARCVSICPADAYTLDEPKILVLYNFLARPDGWDARFVDQGHRRRIKDSAGLPITPMILDPKSVGQVQSKESLLDGKGDLWDNRQSSKGFGPPAGATLDAQPKAVFLKYQVYVTKPFAPLAL